MTTEAETGGTQPPAQGRLEPWELEEAGRTLRRLCRGRDVCPSELRGQTCLVFEPSGGPLITQPQDTDAGSPSMQEVHAEHFPGRLVPGWPPCPGAFPPRSPLCR